jgi:hypothetical protein
MFAAAEAVPGLEFLTDGKRGSLLRMEGAQSLAALPRALDGYIFGNDIQDVDPVPYLFDCIPRVSHTD